MLNSVDTPHLECVNVGLWGKFVLTCTFIGFNNSGMIHMEKKSLIQISGCCTSCRRGIGSGGSSFWCLVVVVVVVVVDVFGGGFMVVGGGGYS
jgi:hypothetical protein